MAYVGEPLREIEVVPDVEKIPEPTFEPPNEPNEVPSESPERETVPA